MGRRVTHTNRWHASHGTIGSGHVYQGRFKSFLIQRKRVSRANRESGLVEAANPIYNVLCYIKRNALSAGLVKRAQNWQ